MSDTPDEDESHSGPLLPTTLLGAQPPTDPLILKRMAEEHIEKSHYAAMGRVAANWAFLEATVDSGSIFLCNVHARHGLCLASQIFGINRKLDAYISLARLRPLPQGLITKLTDFAEDSRRLGGRRDRIMHDTWEFEHPSPPTRFEILAQKKLTVRVVTETTEAILQVADDIDKLITRFGALEMEVALVPSPSPRKRE
jgi:hypothetical protein